ncbi:hypothetical protein FWD20_00755 [Candidatus Saccharibacteria bacterium]|nr:hypothetical protein [Candidatus Saccharibacteria bacterium]
MTEGFGFDIKRFYYDDFQDEHSTPETRAHIVGVSEEAAAANREFKASGGVISDLNNPGLEVLLKDAPQLLDYQRLIKLNMGAAMMAFYDPFGHHEVPVLGENFDEATIRWATDQLFGMGLRWRGGLEASLLEEDLLTGAEKALILGCGAGHYPIQAVRKLMSEGCDLSSTQLTLVDNNNLSIRQVREAGLTLPPGLITAVPRDVLHERGYRRDHLTGILGRWLMYGVRPIVSGRKIGDDYGAVTDFGLIGCYLPPNDFKARAKLGPIAIAATKKGGDASLRSMWEHTSHAANNQRSVTVNSIVVPPEGSRGDAARLQHELIEVIDWPALRLTPESEMLGRIALNCPGVQQVEIHYDPNGIFVIYKIRNYKL